MIVCKNGVFREITADKLQEYKEKGYKEYATRPRISDGKRGNKASSVPAGADDRKI